MIILHTSCVNKSPKHYVQKKMVERISREAYQA